MMDKPLLTYKYERSTPYAEDGLALEIDDYSQINETLLNFLRNPKMREKFRKNRQKYIRDQVYKTDGRATERIMVQIERLLKK